MSSPTDPHGIFKDHCCRICNSEHISYVRDVKLRRMDGTSSLYYCMECESFWHPLIYTEPDDQLKRDAEWHISVEERNSGWANNFLNAIVPGENVTSLLEIGCGTGTLLSLAEERGLKVKGYDTNPYVPEIARTRHNLEIETTYWNSESLSEKYDLVVSISTFEHLDNPQYLLNQIATYCSRHGSAAYISVPFISERTDWHYMLEETPKEIQNPLYLVDVHVNHFSRKGFETMARNYGATHVEYYPNGWIGYLLKF